MPIREIEPRGARNITQLDTETTESTRDRARTAAMHSEYGDHPLCFFFELFTLVPRSFSSLCDDLRRRQIGCLRWSRRGSDRLSIRKKFLTSIQLVAGQVDANPELKVRLLVS